MILKGKRWVLFLGSLAFLTASLLLPGELGKLAVLLLGAVALLAFLYRNMGELTQVEQSSPKLGLLKQTVIFSFAFLALAAGAVWLSRTGRVSGRQEELLAVGLVSAAMLYIGNVSPRLPFNRYVGFRLPWTVTDEDTWILCHRLVGYTTLPTAVLYVAGILALPGAMALVSVTAILIWMGIPGGLSGLFFYRKFHPKT
ncbi:MAG TPA: SdpI family protein [Candidatus Enterenecus stercoripullorum]|nr:SdpI family protein [Candidatus Enterenecus stercoripullorum]